MLRKAPPRPGNVDQATAFEATIVSPIAQHGYQSYTAADRKGRHWNFAQAPARRR